MQDPLGIKAHHEELKKELANRDQELAKLRQVEQALQKVKAERNQAMDGAREEIKKVMAKKEVCPNAAATVIKAIEQVKKPTNPALQGKDAQGRRAGLK